MDILKRVHSSYVSNKDKVSATLAGVIIYLVNIFPNNSMDLIKWIYAQSTFSRHPLESALCAIPFQVFDKKSANRAFEYIYGLRTKDMTISSKEYFEFPFAQKGEYRLHFAHDTIINISAVQRYAEVVFKTEDVKLSFIEFKSTKSKT